MIQLYTVIKNLSSFRSLQILTVCLMVFSRPAIGLCDFRNANDRQIVKTVLAFFGSECSLRAASDGNIIKKLENNSSSVWQSNSQSAQKCYSQFYSQVMGTYFLYKKICADVGLNASNVQDSALASELLEVNKFQSGIRPYHSNLNDCLLSIADRRGHPFIVPLSGHELNVTLLQNELEEANVREPFATTSEPFR